MNSVKNSEGSFQVHCTLGTCVWLGTAGEEKAGKATRGSKDSVWRRKLDSAIWQYDLQSAP
jgi:hypothetical protein